MILPEADWVRLSLSSGAFRGGGRRLLFLLGFSHLRLPRIRTVDLNNVSLMPWARGFVNLLYDV